MASTNSLSEGQVQELPEGQISAAPNGSSSRNHRRSTPATLTLFSILAVTACVICALTTFSAAQSLASGADRARDHTGPVLVATQDVVASIAEADAASAAVYLSGADEDRQQRRLYELAIERAGRQLEQVSRLVGDDAADHEDVQDIIADLVRYAGLVEQARLANANELPGGSDALREAIDIVQLDIVPKVQAINDRAGDRLDDDIAAGERELLLAVAVAVATLVVLIAAQRFVFRRTNRLLNPPLVAATVLVIVTTAWALTAWANRQDDLAEARDGGYDSIELTASIQTTAFRDKTLESIGLLEGTDAAATEERDLLGATLSEVEIDAEAILAARAGAPRGIGLLFDVARAADSTREQAAAAEMLERWQRSADTSRSVSAAVAAGQVDTAIDIAIGAGNADFNGFNTAVESVLSDNRSQFTDGLDDARRRLDWLRLAAVSLPLLAAALAAWGLQLRIREYRR